jgi:hypothetical protein
MVETCEAEKYTHRYQPNTPVSEHTLLQCQFLHIEFADAGGNTE